MARRHQLSERRLPLRQPPSELPFSASPLNVDPVSNDWVLLLLESAISVFSSASSFLTQAQALQQLLRTKLRWPPKFVTLRVTFSVFLSRKQPN